METNEGRQLVRAASLGAIEQVKALLDQDVDVDSRERGRNGQMEASRRGHREVVLYLLFRSSDVNVTDNKNKTALMLASKEGHENIVEILVAGGANIFLVDRAFNSALMQAAFSGHLPVCEFLLSKGADLMAKEKEGQTARSHYGQYRFFHLPPETKALRCAALEAAWAAGPHPSQVQRRHDERWARRGPLLWDPSINAYRYM